MKMHDLCPQWASNKEMVCVCVPRGEKSVMRVCMSVCIHVSVKARNVYMLCVKRKKKQSGKRTS